MSMSLEFRSAGAWGGSLRLPKPIYFRLCQPFVFGYSRDEPGLDRGSRP
jgi:hypothetical protein